MTHQPTVLIVDDSAFSIELMSAFLGTMCDICVAMTGEDALVVARRAKPDLILLDVILPGIDGFAVCETLKDDPGLNHVPIIFSSGNGSLEDQARGMAAGAAAFLPKPIRAAALREIVAAHLAAVDIGRATT